MAKFGENWQLGSWRKVLILLTRKPRHRRTHPSPPLPPTSPIMPKISTLSALELCSRSAAVCRTYSGKIRFLDPKYQYIIGWNLLCRLSAYNKDIDISLSITTKASEYTSIGSSSSSTACMRSITIICWIITVSTTKTMQSSNQLFTKTTWRK